MDDVDRIEGNLVEAPGFAGPGTYTLAQDSACVDSGVDTSAAALGAITVDIEGTARPQGDAYDIGAYERRQAP